MYLSRVKVAGYRAASDAPIECALPGRFSVLLGPNGGGKSTVAEATILAHRDVFPHVTRPSSATLSHTQRERYVEVEYAWEKTESIPLWSMMKLYGDAPAWRTELKSSMGRVEVESPDRHRPESQLPVLYLAPTRNPAVELSGRDARLVVELLKAQSYQLSGSKSLAGLRAQLGNLIQALVAQSPLNETEERVRVNLESLTSGVSLKKPFLASTAVDDAFLARVFEFLLGGAGSDREFAQRIESEGLGYANLLQLAVVLSAIPDLLGAADASSNAEALRDEETQPIGERGQSAVENEPVSDQVRRSEMETAELAKELEDDSLFAGAFNATIIIEEPEAHLHTQLQHGLVTQLRELVAKRPEIQVIMTTHSDQIVAACEPEELVVFSRESSGTRRCVPLKTIGLKARHLRDVRQHLDTARSASLFGERVVLTEGITDVAMLRAFGRVWAGGNPTKKRFIDALTITPVGSKVGEWLPALLTSPGNEIAQRLAVLRDTDNKKAPGWIAKRESDRFQVFFSDPTLEPSIVKGNETIVNSAFDLMMVAKPWKDGAPITPACIENWVRKAGKSRKARFATAIASRMAKRPDEVTVPTHFEDLLNFVYEGFLSESTSEAASQAEADGEPDEGTPA